jgi:hypothetical protein
VEGVFDDGQATSVRLCRESGTSRKTGYKIYPRDAIHMPPEHHKKCEKSLELSLYIAI